MTLGRCGKASLLAGLLILVGTLLRIPALSNSVVDRYSFRQAQTSMVVREFMRDGFDWRTPLPVFGPDSLVPFEFPLFQLIAAQLGNLLRLSPATAGRTLALILFQLSTILIYLLIAAIASREAAVIAVALAQFLPFGIQWGHASLIEFLPVALMLSAAYILVVAQRITFSTFVVVVILVSAASLVKVTTTITLMPLLLLGAIHHSDRLWTALRSRRGLAAISAGAVSVIVAGLWTRAADSVKAAQVETAWLTSASLRYWNFGTLTQRREPSSWERLFDHASTIVPWTLLVVVLLLVATRQRLHRINGLFLLSAFIGPALFFNLYYVHEYYFSAVFFPLIALLALLFNGLATLVLEENRRATVVFLFVVSFASTSFGSAVGRDYLRAPFTGSGSEPSIVADIRGWVEPHEIVVLIGCDWDPTVPYLADRAAYMIRLPESNLSIPLRLQDRVGAIGACDIEQLPPIAALSGDFTGLRLVRVSPNLIAVRR